MGDALEAGGPRRAAIAAVVVVDQRILVAEGVEGRRHCRVVEPQAAMHQQHGAALAVGVVVQLSPVDLCEHGDVLLISDEIGDCPLQPLTPNAYLPYRRSTGK